LSVKRPPLGIVSLILTAWTLLLLVSVSPYAGLLSHHAVGERGLSPVLTFALFMTGWLLMTVAMMLPGTLPTLARLQEKSRATFDACWVVGYLAVWLEIGPLVYAGDLALHASLEPRFPLAVVWIPAVVLLAAGLYQFTPWKRICLAACGETLEAPHTGLDALASGWRHGLACVGSCWALMLVMAALGGMSLAWMVGLGALMAAEKNRRELTLPLGAALLTAAGVTALRVTGLV